MNEKRESTRQKVMKGIFWRYLERTWSQGMELVITLLLARLLLPAQYGLVSIITVFLNIALVFVQSGFGNALIQKKTADDTDFTTVFYFSIGLGCALYAVLFLCAPFIADFYDAPELAAMIRVMALVLPVAGINNVQQAYVIRTMEFRRLFIATLIGSSAGAVFGIGAAMRGAGAWALVIWQLASQGISTLVMWWLIRWRPGRKFSKHAMKKIYSYGWKLLLSSLIDTIYSNLYTLIIGKKFSKSEVGYYDKGRQFPSLIIVNINATIQSVMFPALSREQDDGGKLKEMTRRSIGVSTYIIFPCMAGLAAAARPLVMLLLTEKWLPAVPYLRFCCLSYALWPVFTANLQAINAKGRSDIYLKLELIKKGIGIAILVITLPYGLRAMMIGSCVSSFLGLFVNAAPNKKLIGYSFGELISDIAPSAGLSLLMAAAVVLVGNLVPGTLVKLAAEVLTGIAFYAGISILTKNRNFMYLRESLREFSVGRRSR